MINTIKSFGLPISLEVINYGKSKVNIKYLIKIFLYVGGELDFLIK